MRHLTEADLDEVRGHAAHMREMADVLVVAHEDADNNGGIDVRGLPARPHLVHMRSLRPDRPCR